MIGLEEVAPENLLRNLSRGDVSRLAELYNRKYQSIDPDRAEASLHSAFTEHERPQHDLTQAVVDTFAPQRAAEGQESGFEASVVSPLYEVKENPADLLLVKNTYAGVHFCFISSEVGGEAIEQWAENINRIQEAYQGNEEYLKQETNCEGASVQTVQYVTLARTVDLFELAFRDVADLVSPSNYCIWERNVEAGQYLTKFAGRIANSELSDVMNRELDYLRTDNDELRYTFTSHPILSLGDALLQIVRDGQTGTTDYPREFERESFYDAFRDGMTINGTTGERQETIQSIADNLLKTAVNTEMLYQEAEQINTGREFRVRARQGGPSQIKEMVQNKYIAHFAEEERAELALERARDDFDPEDSSLDDFFGE